MSLKPLAQKPYAPYLDRNYKPIVVMILACRTTEKYIFFVHKKKPKDLEEARDMALEKVARFKISSCPEENKVINGSV